MPAVCREGDLRSTHAGAPFTSAAATGSTDVFVGGKGVQRVGVDAFIPHTSFGVPEAGFALVGSSSVNVNGSPVALVGDSVTLPCVSTLLGPDNPTVFAGN